MKNEIIRQSHERCISYRTKFDSIVMKDREDTGFDTQLSNITSICLKNIKSSFFTLYNTFFTLSNRELIIINHFLNKNSNVDMRKFIPPIGTSLQEKDYGTSATSLAKMKGDVAYVVKNDHLFVKSKELSCVAAPLRRDKEIVGYLSISTLDSRQVDVLRPFIESLSLNIGFELKKLKVQNWVQNYLDTGNEIIMNKRTLDYLTEGEKKVLRFVFQNFSNDMIAKSLYISESAVRKTLLSIYKKTGTNNKFDTIVSLIYKDIFSLI